MAGVTASALYSYCRCQDCSCFIPAIENLRPSVWAVKAMLGAMLQLGPPHFCLPHELTMTSLWQSKKPCWILAAANVQSSLIQSCTANENLAAASVLTVGAPITVHRKLGMAGWSMVRKLLSHISQVAAAAASKAVSFQCGHGLKNWSLSTQQSPKSTLPAKAYPSAPQIPTHFQVPPLN